jgi:hypothetical protein
VVSAADEPLAIGRPDLVDLADPAQPLPTAFHATVVFLVVQSHVVALTTILRYRDDYRLLPATVVLLACAAAIPLACVATAHVRRGRDLPLRLFLAAGAGLLLIDVAAVATIRPAHVSSPSAWAGTAIGVTLLALSPYRPARDVAVLALLHTAVVGIILAVHRDQPSVQPFAVTAALSAALVPALSAAGFVRFFVRAVRRRQEAVAQQARAQSQVLAAAAVTEDADRRLARLRTEVLPLLEDVVAGRRGVDDVDGAALAQRLSAELRRELVEARSGAWLLQAPVPAVGTDISDPLSVLTSEGVPGDPAQGWPGIVLLDPERLLGRLTSDDRAALGAVLAALRAVGGWTEVSVALSTVYGEHGAVEDAAFVTVVATGPISRGDVDAAVRAAASRAGCAVTLEEPGTCVAEGRLAVRRSARLDR